MARALRRRGGAPVGVPQRAKDIARPARRIVLLEDDTQIPKYLQMVEGVIAGLRAGTVHKGTRLPSINQACRASGLSRDTVVKAYDRLQELGYLSAIHGKGFFLRTDALDPPIRALVVFARLTAYKEQEYAGLADTVSGRADLDVCFHHFDAAFFARLLREARGKYDRYLIEPFAAPEAKEAVAALEEGGEEILVVDLHAGVPGRHTSWIVQDFEGQLVAALQGGLSRLRCYEQFTLVFPPDHNDPVEIKDSFLRFGRLSGIRTSVVPRLTEHMIQPGTAYLVLDDRDLLGLVKHCNATGRRLGSDVGLLSYNDNPLKEVVAGGVSVISIDFYGLGVRAGQHLLDPRPVRETVPTRLILRGTL